MVDDQQIEQIFARIDKQVLQSSFLGKGEASANLKVLTDDGIYVLKTALYPKRKNKVLNEVNFRNQFINNGISCIPNPVYSDSEIFPNGAVIYEYIEGEPPDFHKIEILKQFAQILTNIHKVKYEIIENAYSQIEKIYQFLRTTLSRITQQYPNLINPSIKSAFSQVLVEFNSLINENELNIPFGINAQLHGDLSNNFVMDPDGKIWLIDWENSEFGDIVDEICWFLCVNEIQPQNQRIFFQEYQDNFEITQKIDFEKLSGVYFASYPVFDICWGIGQMTIQMENDLEPPNRKLRDLAISAEQWSKFYSKSTSSLIIKGIDELKHSLLD